MSKIDENEVLNARQKRFCEEYVIDHNASQSYIRAGYSKNGAGQSARALLKNPLVIEYIAKIDAVVTERLMDKYEITADRIMRERAMIAFFRPNRLYDIAGNLLKPHLWPDDVSAAVESCNLSNNTVKTHSKDSSLQALEKIKGMYAEDNKQKRNYAEMPEDELDAQIRELETEAQRLGVQ